MADPAEPVFLVRLEPWPRVFFRNFTNLFTRNTQETSLPSALGVFWPDVFVREHVPWNKFLQSLICHSVAVIALSAIPRVLPRRVPLGESPAFNRADVIYYSPSEYLPALSTGGSDPQRRPQKADPEYARQAIISVPREPDNQRQTIVTPPPVRLDREVALPNMVAWSQVQPTVPLEATADNSNRHAPMVAVPVVSPAPQLTGTASRQLSALQRSIVAPPPETNLAILSRVLQGPQATVIEPSPNVEVSSVRVGKMNMGHFEVVSPAPALPVAEQRRIGPMVPGSSVATTAVVGPAPSLSGAASGGNARLIALGIHPAALAQSVEVPGGSRRGTFAATPSGRKGGSGNPGSTINNQGSEGTDAVKNSGGLPAGLLVEQGPTRASKPGGQAAASDTLDPSLSAKLRPPTAADTRNRPAAKISDAKVTDVDRQIFGARKFYSMTLNMPNLNSAGGSWVIRFAELKENETKGDLSAPVATQKVDPPYPTELMRHNVQGTVTLGAVIRSDGSVGNVRVLRGVDDRLDEYACKALLQWHFLPALKNGSAVDLEAVVIIPFRPSRTQSEF